MESFEDLDFEIDSVVPVSDEPTEVGVVDEPALVAEWVKPLAAVHAGQGSLPVRVEA